MSPHETADPQVLVPTSIERVRFHDGQLVDADALNAAMLFPASLLQLVLRSYFGCGIVCGLEVDRPDPERPCVTIGPGVMVDCDGYPLELCRQVVLDLTPDPCGCEDGERTLCIVMRRGTSDDAPRQPCGCGSGGDHHDCNRVRDQVLIKAVDLDALDPVRDHVCALDPEPGTKTGCEPTKEQPKEESKEEAKAEAERPMQISPAREREREHRDCLCLMACGEHCCADRSWVLLGCVTISPAKDPCSSGVTVSDVDPRRRKYVKPIECCRSSHRRESVAAAEPGPLTEAERRERDQADWVPDESD